MIAQLIARYGWKTVTGTALLTAGQIAPTIPWLAPYTVLLTVTGTALGGFGVLHKFDKLAQDVLSAPKDGPHA
jgi:hypothetical protein